jgi:hypothetical protein
MLIPFVIANAPRWMDVGWETGGFAGCRPAHPMIAPSAVIATSENSNLQSEDVVIKNRYSRKSASL